MLARRVGFHLWRGLSSRQAPALPALQASEFFTGVGAAQERWSGVRRGVGLLGLAAASLLSGAGPALCSSFAGSSEDEFTPSEEYSSADDAAGPRARHEKAYNRNLENSRKRRADQRGGADPTPAGERHLSHQDQHAKEVSADAVIAACKFQCNCGFANCVQPSVELVETCRTRKYETKRGPWLGDIVRNAAVRGPDGALRLDKKTCVIPIGNGLVACWRRFNSIFAVKEKMQSKLVTYAQAAIPPASLWSDHVMRLKRDVAPKRECAQEWIRAWAQHVGCFMPNGTNAIHVDATQLKTVWKLYNHETPQTQTSYPHFTKAYNTEKDIPPVIRQRKKKDVSSPCLDCVRLNELLGKAKASEMLMVWPMTDAARATCIADGVYTLAVEQLHDLQDWCVLRSCLSPHLALTRRSLSTETIDVVDNKDDATSNSDDDEPVACKRSRKGGAAAGGSRRKGAPRAQARAAGAAAAPSGLRGASARAPAPASGMHTRARAQS